MTETTITVNDELLQLPPRISVPLRTHGLTTKQLVRDAVLNMQIYNIYGIGESEVSDLDYWGYSDDEKASYLNHMNWFNGVGPKPLK